jgi:hypothetical protein
VEYVCADGGRIPNLGEKRVNGLSDDGQKLAINFQVTSVNQVLVAVPKLTLAGHDVDFRPTFGVITHGVTKRQTKFPKKNGVYMLKIWVLRHTSAGLPSAGKPAGSRQAAASSSVSGGTRP